MIRDPAQGAVEPPRCGYLVPMISELCEVSRGAMGRGVSAPDVDSYPFDTLFNAFHQSPRRPVCGG